MQFTPARPARGVDGGALRRVPRDPGLVRDQPAGVGARWPVGQPPAREHRAPPPATAARRLPGDRRRGRVRVRPGELRPFASIIDGAIAGAFGVRTACVVLATPALACAGWMALRARTRG